MAKVVFSSVRYFQPSNEASGYVVGCFLKDEQRWLYHPGPQDGLFFRESHARELARKVALAGEINAGLWTKDFPLSDFEAHERKYRDHPKEKASS